MCTNPFQIASQAASVLGHASNNFCTPNSSLNSKKPTLILALSEDEDGDFPGYQPSQWKTLPPSGDKDGLENLLGSQRKVLSLAGDEGGPGDFDFPGYQPSQWKTLSPSGDKDEFEDPPAF